MSQEAIKRESEGQQGGHLKPSSAPKRREQESNIDNLVESIPPDTLEIISKLLEKAGEDPAKIRQIISQFKWASYRGDLPPAEVFGEYEREYPGAGAWLLERITTQSNKRLEIAQLQAEGQETRADRAQWLGFGVATCGIIIAGFAHVLTGSWIFPSILAIAAIGGPAGFPILARALQKYFGGSEEQKG